MDICCAAWKTWSPCGLWRIPMRRCLSFERYSPPFDLMSETMPLLLASSVRRGRWLPIQSRAPQTGALLSSCQNYRLPCVDIKAGYYARLAVSCQLPMQLRAPQTGGLLLSWPTSLLDFKSKIYRLLCVDSEGRYYARMALPCQPGSHR